MSVAYLFSDTRTETVTHRRVVMTGVMGTAVGPPAGESTPHRAVKCATRPGIPTAHVVLMATQPCHPATTVSLSAAEEETDLTGGCTLGHSLHTVSAKMGGGGPYVKIL